MVTLKLFGINSNQVITILKDKLPQIFGSKIHFFDGFMETKIELADEVWLADLSSLLREYIYAFEDVSIYEMAARYIDVRGKRISFVELGSCGRITSGICEYLANNQLISESFSLMNTNAIIKHFEIDEKNLAYNQLVSFKNAHDIASYMREKTMSDIVVVNLSELDANNTNYILPKEMGLSYISIGDSDDILTKKFNFIGRKKEIIEGVAKMSCFLLINKLK